LPKAEAAVGTAAARAHCGEATPRVLARFACDADFSILDACGRIGLRSAYGVEPVDGAPG